jgi:hypothetical protein
MALFLLYVQVYGCVFTVRASVWLCFYCTCKCMAVFLLCVQVYGCVFTVRASVWLCFYCRCKCMAVFLLYVQVYDSVLLYVQVYGCVFTVRASVWLCFYCTCKCMAVFLLTFYATCHFEGAMIATEMTPWWCQLDVPKHIGDLLRSDEHNLCM